MRASEIEMVLQTDLLVAEGKGGMHVARSLIAKTAGECDVLQLLHIEDCGKIRAVVRLQMVINKCRLTVGMILWESILTSRDVKHKKSELCIGTRSCRLDVCNVTLSSKIASPGENCKVSYTNFSLVTSLVSCESADSHIQR